MRVPGGSYCRGGEVCGREVGDLLEGGDSSSGGEAHVARGVEELHVE